jgi:hypothetical protein
MKENYYYDEMEQLISTKVLIKIHWIIGIFIFLNIINIIQQV